MKKLLIVLAFLSLNIIGFSQEIGVRGGDVLGNNFAVDAVFSTGEYNRLHADVSFGSGIGAELLWDFLYRPINIGKAEFKWYVGVGPSALIGDPFLLGVSGEGGLEYHFPKIPLALGADWRPTFFMLEDTEFHIGGFGLNARYVFGKK